MAGKKAYKPFSDKELADAMRRMRTDKRFVDVMPEPGELKIDWFLLHAMSKEIAKRRTSRVRLALLTSTVVREFVPETGPGTDHLHEAYKCLLMNAFRRRKDYPFGARATEPATEYPLDAPDQPRMI
jgi:hypothetical protein